MLAMFQYCSTIQPMFDRIMSQFVPWPFAVRYDSEHTAMDDAFQAILDSLPPKLPRSKLEPYAELIQELRKRGRSYREIASILADRCGVTAGTHTVYNFVRVRAQAQRKAKPARAGAERSSQIPAPSIPVETAATPPAVGNDEVWQRIQALKQRTTPRDVEEKEFTYDANEPLRLISDPRKEVKP